MRYRLPTCAVAVLLAATVPPHLETTGAEAGLDCVMVETFDDLTAGPLSGGTNGWELLQQTGTSATIVSMESGGNALRILDNHSAAQDATCRLRRRVGPIQGRSVVNVRLMVTRGEADKVSHDMGLHLYDRGLLLDVFFSGGELKTWQGPSWASLAPPVHWRDGRWLDLHIALDPPNGTATLTVDGEPRKPVALRRTAPGLSQVELTSQRYAQGELWVDALEVFHEVPEELRTAASAPWETASATVRQNTWFPDVGSELREDELLVRPGKLASARRLLGVDMAVWPVIFLDIRPRGDVRYTLYARAVGEPDAHVLTFNSREVVPLNLDLFALTALQGRQKIELLLSARGDGSLYVGAPGTEGSPPAGYLRDPDSVWRFVQPGRRPNALAAPLPLTVTAHSSPKAHVSFGVPFAAGVLSDPARLALAAQNDAHLPLQSQVLSAWGDGSVRWLLLDTQVAVPASGSTSIQLLPSPPAEAAAPIAAAEGDRIVLDTGGLLLGVPTRTFGAIQGLPAPLAGPWDFTAVVGDRRFTASQGAYQARIETNGHLRATLVMSGTLSNGQAEPFAYELRLTALRNLPHLLLAPTFTLISPAAEVQLRGAALTFAGAFGPGQVTVGGDGPQVVTRGRGMTASLLQDSLDHYAIHTGDTLTDEGTKAEGWLATKGIAVAVRRFWQQFAKRLLLSDTELRIELWTPAVPPRRFGRGAAKTHEILLAVGGTPSADFRRSLANFETPPALHPGPAWYARTLALGRFPLPSEQNRDIDGIYAFTLERRISERERMASASYGMVNYGDIRHINSEIDAHKAMFLQWARTGERKWLDFGLDGALHSQDIDVCHYSPNPREIGIHHSHYPSDHNNGGLTLTHTWIEGQLLRYYLTGDRRSLLAADLAGRAFARSMAPDGRLFDAGDPASGIGSRGYGRACWALCELFRATHNPRYLRAMNKLNSYLSRSLREDGAVPASHDADGTWNDRDECPHMAAICSVGLARYIELTGDRSLLPALERIARWQISRGMVPEKLGIMYHNYPGGEVIHFVDACADMLEAWAYLYDTSGDTLYRDAAEMVYDTMIEMNERWRRDWTLCVRNALFYLARRDAWESPAISPGNPPGRTATVRWLRACQTPEGGFSTVPGLPADMDSTFRALDCLQRMEAGPTARQACTDWVLSCRNADGGYAVEPGWHSNVAWTYLALRSLSVLGAPVPEPSATVEWLTRARNDDGGSGSSPVTGRLAYHPAWPSSAEYTAYGVQALLALGTPAAELAPPLSFLRDLQEKGAGFRHRGGTPSTAYTLNALDALSAAGSSPSDPGSCIDWLLSLRQKDGGYGWPGATHSTVRNTAHCLLSLRHLRHSLDPEALSGAAQYVLSCQHSAGGFGYRPGRTPTVVSTWYAASVLSLVNASN